MTPVDGFKLNLKLTSAFLIFTALIDLTLALFNFSTIAIFSTTMRDLELFLYALYTISLARATLFSRVQHDFIALKALFVVIVLHSVAFIAMCLFLSADDYKANFAYFPVFFLALYVLIQVLFCVVALWLAAKISRVLRERAEAAARQALRANA